MTLLYGPRSKKSKTKRKAAPVGRGRGTMSRTGKLSRSFLTKKAADSDMKECKKLGMSPKMKTSKVKGRTVYTVTG